MKELSIEQKAQRYDEALKYAKIYYKEGNEDMKMMMKTCFPVLVEESEDEKIRGEIYENIRINNPKEFADRYIAWIEAQCEHANFRNAIQVGDHVTRNRDGVLVNLSQLNRVAKKQDEQKPVENSAKVSESSTEEKDMGEYKKGFECGKQRVLKYPEDFGLCKKSAWSEEDEINLEKAIWYVENPAPMVVKDSMLVEWLKSLKDRVLPQPKQEWSEEDEKEVAVLEAYIRSKDWSERHIDRALGIVDELVKKIKSLRPQNTWKPSDEQIKALNYYIKNDIDNEGIFGSQLFKLYQDLLKLK